LLSQCFRRVYGLKIKKGIVPRCIEFGKVGITRLQYLFDLPIYLIVLLALLPEFVSFFASLIVQSSVSHFQRLRLLLR
jgi:hypothetical protein